MSAAKLRNVSFTLGQPVVFMRGPDHESARSWLRDRWLGNNDSLTKVNMGREEAIFLLLSRVHRVTGLRRAIGAPLWAREAHTDVTSATCDFRIWDAKLFGPALGIEIQASSGREEIAVGDAVRFAVPRGKEHLGRNWQGAREGHSLDELLRATHRVIAVADGLVSTDLTKLWCVNRWWTTDFFNLALAPEEVYL